MTCSQHSLERIVEAALAEDLGGRGDVTTLATVPEDCRARLAVVPREPGVLAGRAVVEAVYARLDPGIEIQWHADDGHTLLSDEPIAHIAGPARAILSGERVALNFLGRLSGIATLTRRYVDAVAGTRVRIAHTRKTTPGLRALEIEAVLAGGGAPHRFGLDDAVLIKDNHVALAGGVAGAVRRARAAVGHMTRVAVEIDHLDQLDEAIEAGADSVLLDNFSPADLRAAVQRRGDRNITLEASGGIRLDNVREIAETGIDVISIGALTHSVRCLDLGLDTA
ncbi:MAG: carboxylating nicotinate-nucleotide diphosphorylase [Wenzhouxiangellaceae bacterium]